ncbi:MAG: hypothetical protein MI741_18150, partial [Rhodospirillales bacterium]|nr:hypothetical protein [Rhodospirillales bacterium]
MASGTHDLTMADGTAFYIRPCLEPGTPFTRQFLKDQIRAAVGCMSEQTRWHRFISVAPALSEPHLDHLTDIDGDQRVAWCAGAFVADQHRGIGLAR